MTFESPYYVIIFIKCCPNFDKSPELLFFIFVIKEIYQLPGVTEQLTIRSKQNILAAQKQLKSRFL